MSPHQIVTVAVRLFAVWLGVYVLRNVPSFYFASDGNFPSFAYTYALFFFLVTVVIVLALWFFPRTIAGKLLPTPVEAPVPAASPDTWLAMGCALIGIWMLTYAVPALVRDAIVLGSAAASPDEDKSSIKSWVYYNLIELVIALWLVFGAKGFRRLFWWARNAGYSKAS